MSNIQQAKQQVEEAENLLRKARKNLEEIQKHGSLSQWAQIHLKDSCGSLVILEESPNSIVFRGEWTYGWEDMVKLNEIGYKLRYIGSSRLYPNSIVLVVDKINN